VNQNVITYCTSKGSNVTREYINTVSLGTFTNTSGSNGGYGNFTATVIPALSGQSYSLTLKPGYTGSKRSEYWRVWIDYNKDGDFLDSGELAYSANARKGDVTGTITIPAGLTGQTRIRISMKYNAAPTSCESFTYGEVEDYTVSFSAAKDALVTNGSGISIAKSAVVSQENKLNLEIYPNPASNLLNLLLTGNAETVNIKVYNALGQIIDDFNVNTNRATIDLSNYQKGMYFIGADDGIQNTLKKFIRE
jgi:bacillolysin